MLFVLARNMVFVGAIVASSIVVLPEALRAGRLVLPQTTAEEIADYRLRSVTTLTYEHRTNAALAADDPDLADSLVALADGRHTPLPAEMRTRVVQALEFSLTRTLRETWKGISEGMLQARKD